MMHETVQAVKNKKEKEVLLSRGSLSDIGHYLIRVHDANIINLQSSFLLQLEYYLAPRTWDSTKL
jgi:hypothetical protein